MTAPSAEAADPIGAPSTKARTTAPSEVMATWTQRPVGTVPNATSRVPSKKPSVESARNMSRDVPTAATVS